MMTAANEQGEQLSREELLALVIRQQEIIAHLETEVAALKAELEKFRRPRPTSRNSSQPPSLDQKANSDPQRKKRKKKRRGHARQTRPLVEKPDQIIPAPVSECRTCRANLTKVKPERVTLTNKARNCVMKVQELMTNDVCVCGPETNLAEAAGLMWGYDCGILPVVADDGKVIGAITDRDICMAVATRNQLASEIKVSEVMSGAIHACRAADDVKQALKVMEREQVRRLPIVNNDGKLQGILSIRDIVLRAEDGHGKRHSELSHEDTVGALKAICADRRPEASHRSSRKSAATQA